MAILVTSGHAAIAQAIKQAGAFISLGHGLAAWDATPEAPDMGATSLVDGFCWRESSVIMFCTPDAVGDLITPSGRYSESATPTRHLFMRFEFDYGDGVGEAVREAGIFLGAKKLTSVPAAQKYLLPADMESTGTLLLLDRFTKVQPSPTFRPVFEFVITL